MAPLYKTVEVRDEGTAKGRVDAIDFAGAGVSAAVSGNIATVTITGGAFGTTTVDFGAFPGKSDTSVAITGQTAIVAGSSVIAWLTPKATTDHTADEHICETIKVFAGNIVSGTGFTIYAVNSSQLNEPLTPRLGTGNITVVGQLYVPPHEQVPLAGGIGTTIYGKWSISWIWG